MFESVDLTCEIIARMSEHASPLALANDALRQGPLDRAVALYGAARRDDAELIPHIDFNIQFIGRRLSEDELSPISVIPADWAEVSCFVPSCDVLVIVVATSLAGAGRTARLISRRANYKIGIVVLLKGTDDSQLDAVLLRILGRTKAKYALAVSEAAFPGRDWLRSAYKGMEFGSSVATRANTGTGTSMREGLPPWLSVFTSPRHLARLIKRTVDAEKIQINEPNFLLAETSRPSSGAARVPPRGAVHVVQVEELQGENVPRFTREVCVVMPCVDPKAGRRTAKMLLERAGMEADVVVAIDTNRQGFIRTLNQVVRSSGASLVVYLAEDAWPGQDWLRAAYQKMKREEKAVLAFNCGKWGGRIAAFGMVNKAWAYSLYGDSILFEGYKAHRADNELTVIARAREQFVYGAECVLVELDSRKDFRLSERSASNFNRSDARLFRRRFLNNFGGLVAQRSLETLHDEYMDLPAHYSRMPRLEIK